ncbi:MAG TPA: histidine kinase N-terminal 7TM domain-containing protein [Caproiciproducens sp.]|nr:histidine kinase N-terminal 7TM domain-containing protein [Caproiciproducens sp.]
MRLLTAGAEKRKESCAMLFFCTSMLVLSLLIGAVLIAYSWKKRGQPGAADFIALVAVILVVNGGYIGELNSSTLSQALFWSGIEHLTLPLHPYFWLLMCLDYTRACKNLRRIRLWLLAFPTLYYFIFYTNPILHLYVTEYRFESNGYFSILHAEKGWGFALLIALITVIGAACVYFYFRGYRKVARLYRGSYLHMLIGSLLPWGTIYLNLSNTNYLGLDYYSFLVIISGILFLLGIFRYHLFSTAPIATETVFRLSQDGIAIADIDGHIMDANESFLRYYPELRGIKEPLPLTNFLGSHEELAGLSPKSPNAEFQRGGDGKKRYCSARLAPVSSETGTQIGTLLSIRDITVYVENQNHLKALAQDARREAEANELLFLQAQISPHFINNTLSVIASMISRDDEKARDLVVDLSEYLINCYRVVNSPLAPLSQELEAVKTYIRIVQTRFGEHVRFSLEADNLPEMELPRLVLQPLVENAVRHGVQPKEEGGTVRLLIRRENSRVLFEIIDDGVGIQPERVTSLLEGSDNRQGVGLINIHKRLTSYYGDGLHIESNSSGTTVSFSVPLTEQVGEEACAE